MRENDMLAGVPLFAELSPSQRQKVSRAMQQRSYRPGEVIVAQSQPATGLVLLASGQASLFHAEADGSQTPLATLAAGQHLNQDALFQAAAQPANLRAIQPCIVYELTRAAFAQLLTQEPDIRVRIVDKTEVDAGDANAAAINPSFAEQRQDEEILIRTHRHFWSFMRSAWLPLLLLPAMWLAAALVEAQAISLGLLALSAALPGFGLLYFFLEWRNDSVIVTDQRVIRITRTILTLHRQVTQVGMESIHEINFDIPAYDPFARLFRYGTVIVKTAGAQGNLELPFMPRPQRFQQLIMEDRQYFEQRQAQRHHKLVREEMQRWLAGEADQAQNQTQHDGPPYRLPGSRGYLCTKIEMSNGDKVYRKHISVWAQHTALPILTIMVGIAALGLTFTLVSPEARILTFPAGMVALLAGCLAYYWLDWDWRNDVYIISDDTITLVRKRPFFLQNIRDQILVERIDNVESVSTGLFAALFKYGDVNMSLIGADEPKRFVKVARPRAIQQEISRRQHNKAQRRAQYDARQQQQILGEYLGLNPADHYRPATNATQSPIAGMPEASVYGQAVQTRSNGEFRAARNIDRNRPPRLPAKVPPVAAPAAQSSLDSDSQRLPARLRPDNTN